jgi:hypothetical protein
MSDDVGREFLERLQQAQEIHAQAARVDPSAFMEFVLKDEMTGQAIELAPMHTAWQSLMMSHRRLLLWSHTEGGKTQQVSIGRVLWELGRNPNARIVIISNTHEQAAKIVRTVAKYIEGSAELAMVFPKLKKGDPWTSHHLFVQREVMGKDPSLQACGIHGNILGARIDLLIFDDILDYENCRTPAAREDLWKWIHATLIGRLTKDAKVWIVGNAYHPDDALHRFARQPVWTALRYPVVDPTTGESRWPERWPKDRIEARRAELGPLEFARQMMCQARDDSESRFKQEWIDLCLERGRGRKLVPNLVGAMRGRVFTGVDLAVQKHAAAGRTVLFTILIGPDGSREVLNIEASRWSGPEIVQRIIGTHHRYNSIMIVENNAAQQYLVQFAGSNSAVPIRPFTTGRNKAHPEFGVESLAVELSNAKWVIPNDGPNAMHPEVAQWIQEMLFYDPNAHTGDTLMASWFAREGARMCSKKMESGRIDLTSR